MPAAEPVTLTVERVGVRGDGIAHHQGEAVYLPFTAPGDVVRVRLAARRGDGRTAELVELVTASASRAAPVCVHFGTCGGCALQHLDDAAYRAAKEQWLGAALARSHVIAEAIAPLVRLPAGTRRRARVQLAQGRAGFHARASHRVIDLKECAVLHPKLVALVAPLRRLLPDRSAIALATLTDTGIDLRLEFAGEPDLARLEALGQFAAAQDLARLTWRSDGLSQPIALRRPAQVTLSGVVVDLPEECFLQPSLAAEAALVTAVTDMVGPARRIADLYAGIGTFSFALARGAEVHATEGAAEAVAALTHAARRAGLQGSVAAERRDLAANALTPEECARFDAVVFDPPYAGAIEQSRALAASPVPRIVAVSCNPATFARDARILVAGGYRLAELRPFDAFPWSANLELVARFERG